MLWEASRTRGLAVPTLRADPPAILATTPESPTLTVVVEEADATPRALEYVAVNLTVYTVAADRLKGLTVKT
jgi:Lhr-like helicase